MLSYPSLTCILEHVEANRRIHITTRCPSLCTIDKVTPLHLRRLLFKTNEITLNEINYTVLNSRKQEPGLMPRYPLESGDIALNGYTAKASYRYAYPPRRAVLEIQMHNGNRMVIRTVPQMYEDCHEAVRKLIDFLLAGRRSITVDILEFRFGSSPVVVRLPAGLKFKARLLNVGEHSIEAFSPLLTESSIPLTALEINGLSRKKLKQPVVQRACGIYIENPRLATETGMRLFLRLKNPAIRLNSREVTVNELLEVAKYWVENGKDKCSYLFVARWDREGVEELVKKAKEMFGVNYVKMQNAWRQLLNSRCVAIPIKPSPNTVLVVHGSEDLFSANTAIAIMRVMSTDLVTTLIS